MKTGVYSVIVILVKDAKKHFCKKSLIKRVVYLNDSFLNRKNLILIKR